MKPERTLTSSPTRQARKLEIIPERRPVTTLVTILPTTQGIPATTLGTLEILSRQTTPESRVATTNLLTTPEKILETLETQQEMTLPDSRPRTAQTRTPITPEAHTTTPLTLNPPTRTPSPET